MKNRSVLHAIPMAVLFLALTLHPAFSQEDDPPNIIIIYTDDLGYGDLGCYGAKGYTTPHIDRLAESGIRFTDFLVTEAVCSASRASLLTGCYSERVGIQGALTPSSNVGLNPEEVTIAEMLKKEKYKTAIIGKWHLGVKKKFLPKKQGFDYYYGLPYSNDMWPVGYDGKPSEGVKGRYPALMLYKNTRPVRPVETLGDQAMLTSIYTEEAVRFIEKNHKKRFFLYLAYSMPHVPLAASRRFSGKTKNGLFGDVIAEIDWSVGKVMETLRKYDLEENTLVIFASDNGPWLSMGNHAGSAGPLREGKGTAFEGGVRVPCIISWPEALPDSTVSHTLVTTMDILPTIADITGASLPEKKIDGVSILAHLQGEEPESPRDEFWYYYGGELRAVRKDKWKLVLPHYSISYKGVEPGQDGYPGKYAYFNTGMRLYNLEGDVGEVHDVSGIYSGIAEDLMSVAAAARAELGDRLQGEKGSGVRQPGRVYPTKSITVKHKARGRRVTLNAPPNPKYHGEGPKTLVDGYRGSMDFHDGQWLGFRGQDIEMVIDMGKTVRARRVSCSFMENQGSWIFLPAEVIFYLSGDGVNYEKVNHFSEELHNRSTATVKEYETVVRGRDIRFIKIVARNAGPCPVWHPGRGEDSWVFIDEVMVK